MLAIERRQKIIEIIQEDKKVLVNEVAAKFAVTEETIRRDLENLESKGVLKRTYGGAILNQGTNVDLPMEVREVQKKDEKMRIAEEVSKVIEDGDTLMLDSSSTAYYVAKCIKRNKNKITLITNSLKILMELQDVKEVKLILAGGTFKESSKSFLGKWSENIIKNYYVNKAIICCKGIDVNRGIMDSNEQEAEIKHLMAKSADKVYLVVDSRKLDRISFVKIMNFDEVNYLYTDESISEKWENIFAENNIEIKICN